MNFFNRGDSDARLKAMSINIAPGKYVVAVSGGVDSMVLLDVLSETNDLDLIVAHFDHGIRNDSHVDAEFAAAAAGRYGMAVETERVELGADASEEAARIARYNFLHDIRSKYQAQAIITAHHQDDLLETVVINISRGTGRHGLSSLRSQGSLQRPLLGWSKQDIMDYADSHDIEWREDPTNKDTTLLRNHIRHEILPKLSQAQKQTLINTSIRTAELNDQIDEGLATLLKYKSYRHEGKVYPRSWFNSLPHSLCMDIVHHWMRQLKVHDYSRPKIDRIVLQLKTLRPGKQVQLGSDKTIAITKRSLRLQV